MNIDLVNLSVSLTASILSFFGGLFSCSKYIKLGMPFKRQWVSYNLQKHIKKALKQGDKESFKMLSLDLIELKLYSNKYEEQSTAISQLINLEDPDMAFKLLVIRFGRNPAITDAKKEFIINSIKNLCKQATAQKM